MIGSVNTGGGRSPDLNGSIIRVTANVGANVTVRKGAVKYQKTYTSRLPSGYSEVDYLEVSGTQYLNLGNFKDIHQCKIEIQFDVTQGDLLASTTPTPYFTIINKAMYPFITYNGSGMGTKVSTGVHVLKYYGGKTRTYAEVDGIVNGELTYTYPSQTKTVALFADWNEGSPRNCAQGKCYYLKIWDTDHTTLIRDYVPCIRTSDNKAGMFDLVNNAFYDNKGSGTIVAGPDATSFTYDFTVRYSGRWTVTAEQTGEDTVTEHVDVLADNTVYPVNVVPKYYIIKDGAYQIPLTNVQGFTINTSSIVESGSGECALRTTDKYNFTDSLYNHIVVRFSAMTSVHNYPLNLVVTDQTGSYENYINASPNNPPSDTILYAKKQPITQSAVNELTLSLGTLTGSHYIGIGVGYFQNSSVLDLYLSR